MQKNNSSNCSPIGFSIKEHRESMGLSQVALKNKIFIKMATIGSWKRKQL